MAATPLENVPITIHEQIYDEPLANLTTQSTDKGQA
jgi:hypothetical protein